MSNLHQQSDLKHDKASPTPAGTEVLTEEEKEKIERMNRIRKALAGTKPEEAGSTDLPAPRKKQFETSMLDVSVDDNPPPVQGSEATRAQKLAQIREALAMVEQPAPAAKPVPKSSGSLPPLKKKGSPSRAAIKNAAAETVVAPPKKTTPAPKPAPKPTPVKQTAPAPAPAKKAAPAPAPAKKAAPAKQDAPAQAKPIGKLAPLKRAGTTTKAEPKTTAAPAKSPAAKAPAAPIQKTDAAKKPTVKKETPKAAKPAAAKEEKQLPKFLTMLQGMPKKQLAMVLGGSVGGALLLAYGVVSLVYLNRFLPNTYINDISVGNMTKSQAHDVLMGAVRTDDLVLVTAHDEQVNFAAEEFEASYSLSDTALDEAFGENRLAWLGKLFRRSDYTIKYDFHFSEESLRTAIINNDWGYDQPKDATIVMNADGYYEIVPDELGDRFDKGTLITYIIEQMAQGKFLVEMEASGCYEGFEAAVQSEDLEKQLELYNRFAESTITFDFGDRSEKLEGAAIAEWVTMTNAGDFEFDKEAIAGYVATLASKYDTIGKDLPFRSTLDGLITVPYTSTSLYGWQIDQEATVEQIVGLLQDGASVTVEPVYRDSLPAHVGIGYCRDEKTQDIGDTYVEVDISAQHIWFYKDGAVVMQSDCVTGTETASDRRTPRGVFKIWSHESPRVLGQMEDEGYETWVKYWMPINYIGVGLHDLSRSAYGGNIYMYNGSHGCINLPMAFVEDLYYATENGIPVIIHD